MTRQESFKRRVRARMAHTGERYAAARRQLLAQADAGPGPGLDGGVAVPPAAPPARRVWAADPGMTDDKLAAATGRSWDQWCDVIDAWPGHSAGHTAIAAHLRDGHGVDSWWAQTVTVGWERITGARLPHQMADGTFTANRTRTVTVDVDTLRALLVDDGGRASLFPELATTLRSKPTAKSLRVAFDEGVALFALAPKPGGRVAVTVSHERLPSPDSLDRWRAYWAEWLEAIDDQAPTAPTAPTTP